MNIGIVGILFKKPVPEAIGLIARHVIQTLWNVDCTVKPFEGKGTPAGCF